MALVTVADVKALGRIDYDTHDALIALIIGEVESIAEEVCGIKLSSASHSERVSSVGGNNLWPNFLPVTAVSKIEDMWLDASVVPTDDYSFTVNRIFAEDGLCWESGSDRFRITYTAGYTTATVPSGLLSLLRLLALHVYDGGAYGANGGTARDTLEKSGLLDALDLYTLRRPIE